MRTSAFSPPLLPQISVQLPFRPNRSAFPQIPAWPHCPIRPLHLLSPCLFMPEVANKGQRLEQLVFFIVTSPRVYLHGSVINPLPGNSGSAPNRPALDSKRQCLEQLAFFAIHPESKAPFPECADWHYTSVNQPHCPSIATPCKQPRLPPAKDPIACPIMDKTPHGSQALEQHAKYCGCSAFHKQPQPLKKHQKVRARQNRLLLLADEAPLQRCNPHVPPSPAAGGGNVPLLVLRPIVQCCRPLIFFRPGAALH